MRRFKPAAGKRKAPEPPAAAEAVPEPSQAPHVTPDGDAMAIVPVEEEDADTQSDNGPMTKAKKRKGSNPAAVIMTCYVILPT